MAGVLPFQASRGDLSLGYREARCLSDGLLVRRGEVYAGHEFHRWQIKPTGDPMNRQQDISSVWSLSGWGSPPRLEGSSAAHLHATWLHLHWGGTPELVKRLALGLAAVKESQIGAEVD
jgi:cobyrinic acid a,c-diamide synthase